MTYGLTSAGFAPKSLEEILSDIETEIHSLVDPNLDLSAAEPIGQINGIFAKFLAENWELLYQLSGVTDPDKCADWLLEVLARFTGTKRLPATSTRIDATVSLNAGTVLLPGVTKASVPGTTTIATLRERVPAVGAAPTTGAYAAIFDVDELGPIPVYAGTLSVIATPVAGWTAVTNPLDGNVGRAVETDADLRIRRAAEISAAGAPNAPGISEAVAAVEGVKKAFVIQNDSDFTVDGVPPHCVETVVYDGFPAAASDAEIAAAIYASKAGGISTVGSVMVPITDSEGVTHPIYFSRVEAVPIYLDFAATYDASKWTNPAQVAAGVAAMTAAILEKAATDQTLGRDVVAFRVKSWLGGVDGLANVTRWAQSITLPPVDSSIETQITITRRQLALFDAARITIGTTPETSL